MRNRPWIFSKISKILRKQVNDKVELKIFTFAVKHHFKTFCSLVLKGYLALRLQVFFLAQSFMVDEFLN